MYRMEHRVITLPPIQQLQAIPTISNLLLLYYLHPSFPMTVVLHLTQLSGMQLDQSAIIHRTIGSYLQMLQIRFFNISFLLFDVLLWKQIQNQMFHCSFVFKDILIISKITVDT